MNHYVYIISIMLLLGLAFGSAIISEYYVEKYPYDMWGGCITNTAKGIVCLCDEQIVYQWNYTSTGGPVKCVAYEEVKKW